jgi:hypothetical protein
MRLTRRQLLAFGLAAGPFIPGYRILRSPNGKRSSLSVGFEYPRAEASDITARTCSRGDVGAACNSAIDGDRVIIPPGTASWTTTLSAEITNKSIAILGPEAPDSPLFGSGTTILTDQCDKSAKASMISWSTKATGFPRLSGLRIQGGSTGADSGGTYGGNIILGGPNRQTRLDHLGFATTNSSAIQVYDVCGVADHCTFNQNAHPLGCIDIFHPSWNIPGSDFGDSSWASPSTVGTSACWFLEDCQFTLTTPQFSFAIDGWIGTRAVIRRSQFTNLIIANHGTESGGRWRSARHYEIYQNIMSSTGPGMNTFIGSRGGTGVIFNNQITAVGSSPAFVIFRDFRPENAQQFTYNPWALAGSWNVASLTRSGSTITVVVTPKVVGGQSIGHSLASGHSEYVRIVGCDQSDYNGTFPLASIIDANTFTYTKASAQATTGTGPIRYNQPWDGNTDQNAANILNAWGYPCLDQNGRGQGDLLSGVDPIPVTPGAWPNQVLDPWYVWGNTYNGNPVNAGASSPVALIGRDIINGIKPGYTPFTYPHPLISGGVSSVSPVTPANLTLK